MVRTDVEMIAIHWAFMLFALAFSWIRSRHVMHPHFLFTIMACIFISDFLVRGYADGNIDSINRIDVYSYQIKILSILTLGLIAASIIKVNRIEVRVSRAAQTVQMSPKIGALILSLALAIILIELIKRLWTVGWSLEAVAMQSLQPRGMRNWDQAAYSGNFVFAVIGAILPLSAFSFVFLAVVRPGAIRIVSIGGLAIVLALLITNGSRTPVAITFAALALLLALRQKRLFARFAVVGLVVACAAAIMSVMYTYRSSGYLDESANINISYSAKYHQDDSYYRAIYAYYYSDTTGMRWNAIKFFTTIAVNPIPRAIWPSKPTITSEFYNGFKLDYVTNLYIGESVAIFGSRVNIFFAPLFALMFYIILYRSALLLRYPLGICVYVIFALYVYMCMRSMMNVTQFVYLPLAALFVMVIVKRRASLERSFARRPSVDAG